MKLIMTMVLFLGSTLAVAQNYQGMSEADMQRMMQQAQKMQACMQNVDQAKLQALSNESKQVQAEIKALCTDGKRSKAEKRAYSYAQEINKNPDIAAMRECSKMMQGVMPDMGFVDKAGKDSDNEAAGHICDEM